MRPDPKKYIDRELKSLRAECTKRGKESDCFLIFKSRNRQLVGEPLAVYGTVSGLRKNFPRLVEETDECWGIEVAAWWFDD